MALKRVNGASHGEAVKKTKLLDEESSGDEGDFKINEEYAKRFEHNNKRRELQQLEDKYGKSNVATKGREDDEEGEGDESESSSDEDEDDDGEFATVELDAEITDTLNAIRSKDPRVYNKEVKFYKEFEPDINGASKKPKEESMNLRQYHQRNLVSALNGANGEDKAAKSYVQEQEDVKGDLLQALNDAADEAEGSSTDNEEGFLQRKEKPKGNGAVKSVLPNPKEADRDPETYLSNFLAARAWVPTEDSRFAHLDSDDDEEDQRAERFEAAYNLRFEDPEVSNQTLKSHARDAIAAFTARREEKSSRGKAREREREKKEAIKAVREADKARLKKLKMEQMEGKIDMIRKAAGGKDVDISEWAQVLEEDWDDDRFDQEMRKRFGDDYYNEQEAGSDSDEEQGTRKGKKRKLKKPEWDDDIDIKDLVPDFVEEDDRISLTEDDSEVAEPRPQKQLKQQKADKKAQSRRDRRIIESIVDQNLNLDTHLSKTEKAGIPRFAYRETSPQAFGLSALDTLAADDSQLNQFAGLKKLATFRDGTRKEKDRKKLSKKGRLKEWRKETFGKREGPSVEDWVVEGAARIEKAEKKGEDGVDIKDGARGKKRKRSKKKKDGEGVGA